SGEDAVQIRVGPREVSARLRGREVELDVGEVEVGEPETLEVAGEDLELTPVSVGNPHAVIRREPEREELLRLGPLVENHERFPERTNVPLGLDEVPPYLFAELERKIAAKRREGIEVISLGIGDPDLPTPEPVVSALAAAARDPATHQYPTNHGSAEFREAVAGFYRDRFDVELDPGSEIVPALGGKAAVAHVCLALLDPGAVCLSPDPAYP